MVAAKVRAYGIDGATFGQLVEEGDLASVGVADAAVQAKLSLLWRDSKHCLSQEPLEDFYGDRTLEKLVEMCVFIVVDILNTALFRFTQKH